MGNTISDTLPRSAAATPASYVNELPGITYDRSLGASRFMKTVRGRDAHGALVVIKIFILHRESDASTLLRPLHDALQAERSALLGIPNVFPHAHIVATDRAGYLIREYLYSSLYDRISTHPFLVLLEKTWLIFQLLTGLKAAHDAGVCHGDIKTENVLVTRWNWAVLVDFASYKPLFLPDDHPGDFDFFCDASGRRVCYVAPERFRRRDPAHDDPVDGRTAAPATAVSRPPPRLPRGAAHPASSASAGSAFAATLDSLPTESGVDTASIATPPLAHPLVEQPAVEQPTALTPAMDLFSLGCTIAELLLDSTPLFTFSQLLAYRNGSHDPAPHLAKIECPRLRAMVTRMIDRDPRRRGDLATYLLNGRRDGLFPPWFFDVLHPYAAQLAATTPWRPPAGIDPALASNPVAAPGATVMASESMTEMFLPHPLLRARSRLFAAPRSAREPPAMVLPLSYDARLECLTNEFVWLMQALGEAAVQGPSLPINYADTAALYLVSTPAASSPLLPDDIHEGALLPGANCDACLLLLSMVTSCIKSARWPSSRVQAIDLIVALGMRFGNQFRLDRCLPYLIKLVQPGEATLVRVHALHGVMTVMKQLTSLTASDANLLVDYVLPNLQPLATESERLLRIHFAACLGTLSEACLVFLELGQHIQQQLNTSDDYAGSVSHSAGAGGVAAAPVAVELGFSGYDQKWQELQQIMKESVIALLTDSEPAVKCGLLENIPQLCAFFGRQNTNDFLLSYLITYLNDTSQQVRVQFYRSTVAIAAFMGLPTFEQYLLEIMSQSLWDHEEPVVACVAQSLTALLELGIMQPHHSLKLAPTFVTLVCHPCLFVRHAAIHFLVVAVRRVSPLERAAFWYPLLRPFLLTDLARLDAPTRLIEALRPPVRPILFAKTIQFYQTHPRFAARSRPSRQASAVPILSPSTPATSAASLLPLASGTSPTAATAARQTTLRHGDSMAVFMAEPSSMSLSTASVTMAQEDEVALWQQLEPFGISRDEFSQLRLMHSYFVELAQGAARRKSVVDRQRTAGLTTEGTWSDDLGKRPSIVPLRNFNVRPHTEFLLPSPSLPSTSASLHAASAVSSTMPYAVDAASLIDESSGNNRYVASLFAKKAREIFPASVPELGPRVAPVNLDHLLIGGPLATPSNTLYRAASAWRPKGILIAQLDEHVAPVMALRLCQNHAFFVSGDTHGYVKIWDTQRLERNASHRSRGTYFQGDGLTALAMLDGRQSVVSCARDGTIDINRIDYLATPSRGASSDPHHAMAGRFASAASGGAMCAYTYEGMTHVRRMRLPPGQYVTALDQGETENDLLLCYATNTNHVAGIDLRSRATRFTFRLDIRHGRISALLLDPKRVWLLAGTHDGVFALWDLRFQLPVHIWRHPAAAPAPPGTHGGRPRPSPPGSTRSSTVTQPPHAATSDSADADAEHATAAAGVRPSITRLMAGPQPSTVLAVIAGPFHEVSMWNVATRACEEVWYVQPPGVDVHGDGLFAAAGAAGLPPHRASSIAAACGRVRHPFPTAAHPPPASGALPPAAMRHGIRGISLSPAFPFFVTGGTDRRIRVWDLKRPEASYILSGHVERASLSDDRLHALLHAAGVPASAWPLAASTMATAGVPSGAPTPSMASLSAAQRHRASRGDHPSELAHPLPVVHIAQFERPSASGDTKAPMRVHVEATRLVSGRHSTAVPSGSRHSGRHPSNRGRGRHGNGDSDGGDDGSDGGGRDDSDDRSDDEDGDDRRIGRRSRNDGAAGTGEDDDDDDDDDVCRRRGDEDDQIAWVQYRPRQRPGGGSVGTGTGPAHPSVHAAGRPRRGAAPTSPSAAHAGASRAMARAGALPATEHHDAITDVLVSLVPYPCVVSAGRDGLIKVWK